MAPSISPLTAGEGSYAIVDSAAFMAAFTVDVNGFDTRFFTVTHPENAPGLAIVLRHVALGVEVALHTLTGVDNSVSGYDITASSAPPIGGTVQLTCNLTENTGNGVINDEWQLVVSADSPVNWSFAVDAAILTSVTRLICDPAAAFASPIPSTVFENDTVNLLAANATVGTVVGAPTPTVVYQWSHQGAIAILDLPACGPGQSLSVAMPGVYAAVPVPITLTVGFDTDCAGLSTAFLKRAVTAPASTIQPRPQQIALVLDRSGSMVAENRWTNAQTAARMLTNLYAAIRDGVHPDDRIGIVVFEDEICQFHPAPVSSRIAPVLAPSDLPTAKDAICGLPLGVPGVCTPIGDGLVAGLDMLIAAGKDPINPDADARFTLILLTDGFENAGTVRVGPGTLPPGVTSFAAARTATAGRIALNQRLRIFTVGLGSTVDEQVLNNLAVDGRFLLITDPTQLADAFGQMLTVSQEVNNIPAQLTPPSGLPDATAPAAPANAVYFTSSTGAEKLASGVLATGGVVELAMRKSTGEFVPEGVVAECAGHFIASVSDVPALSEGAIEWRLVHTVGGTPQPLPAANVLVYEDLHVKADLLLDKNEYLTGDSMHLTVRLRHDSEPILHATIRAVLDAPELGLGQTLSDLGPDVKPVERESDQPVPKQALIEQLLRGKGWDKWPRSSPTSLFIDGTDVLHDLDGDGNYTNTFARVLKEGTYTWEMIVEGVDLKGNRFDRRIVISTHAGVKVDAQATKIDVTKLGSGHPSGMLAARIVITPQDVRGERLGPDWDHAVIWALKGGVFEHVWANQPAPVFTDGTYQRVILFRANDRPTVRISAAETILPEIKITGPSK